MSSLCTTVLLAVIVMIVTSRSVCVLSGHCPRDVESATRHCLDDHHVLLQNIQQTETHFFAGVDAEIIRTLCHEFKLHSMHCVKVIQRNCAESRYEAIETALRPYGAFINMCYHQHFIEEYAIIQNCLYSRRGLTDICYQTFLSSTAGHEHLAWQNQQTAIVSYCRSLSELTSCVQSKTRSCSDIETRLKTNQLVSMLVSVSVELNFKCSDDSLGISTATIQGDGINRGITRISVSNSPASTAATCIRTYIRAWSLLITIAVLFRTFLSVAQ